MSFQSALNGFKVKGEMTGLAELQDQLKKLGTDAANKILKPAVTAGAEIIAGAVKQKAPVRGRIYVQVRELRKGKKGNKKTGVWQQVNLMGLLKESIGTVIKTSKKTGVIGKIGVRKGFKVVGGIRTRGKNKGQPWYYSPAKIAHLVELGHGGPHPAPAHPFMRPGFDASKAAASAAMVAEAAARIEKLAAAAKKGP